MPLETLEQLNTLCQQYCDLETFEYLNFRDKLKKYIFELKGMRYDYFGEFNTYLTLTDIYARNGKWHFLYSVHFSSDGQNYFSSEIPVEYYFYTTEQLDAIVNEMNEQREKEKQKIEEANKEQQLNARYKHFLALKAEFEPENQ